MIKIGEKVKNFSLNDKDGNLVSLSDFLGKKVIVYFYPKDNTPGCTMQAKGFRDNFYKFQKNNIVIIGISADSEKSHFNFCEKYSLPFILLSDKNKEVCNLFGVYKEKKLYGKIYLGIVRSTFLIDEKGYLVEIFENVKASKNPEQMLEYLKIKE